MSETEITTGASAADAIVGGPFFDDLARGQVFDGAPAVTLTGGQAAVHQSIVGDRMRLPLDDTLARAVAGHGSLAHPALVWDTAIGQSTLATHHVTANLFYRGLTFRRAPIIGDTLRTTTEVVALRQNSIKPGRHPTGLAALRITTVDQRDHPVLDFWRCAMLPLSAEGIDTGHSDDLDSVGADVADPDGDAAALGAFRTWDLTHFRSSVPGQHFQLELAGRSFTVSGGDVVSSAPELARLTLNIAKVHHDLIAAGGRRLVYGGHTIGIALAQVTRAIPNLVAVVAWRSCDHTGPVHEGDTLHSQVTIERAEPLAAGGGFVHLRSRVTATAAANEPRRDVLDWRFVALMA